MTLNLNIPESEAQLKPRITVVGVGGAGGNAVNNMIQSNLEGVEFVVANTDSQAIAQSLCSRTLQLGRNITQGLGSGSRPDIGRAAAEEALEDILTNLEGAHMVFITAGMGGGTGTGAAPVIARAAREQGILTVGVVTKPFHFEGVHRMRIAEAGIQELTQFVDTLIIIPNQNLFRIANEKTTFADAFKMADDVLHSGVRGVTDLMVMPGLINLDFADIRTVMTEMGKAMMGTGEAEGDNRAIAAAEAAISNPLLEDVSMKGARGVLINITGGPDLTLFEVDEAANRIRDEVDPEANIIFGSTYDDKMESKMRVSVVSTGIDAAETAKPRPVTLSLVAKDRPQGQLPGTAAPAAAPMGSPAAEAAPQPAQAAAEPQRQSIVSAPAAPTRAEGARAEATSAESLDVPAQDEGERAEPPLELTEAAPPAEAPAAAETSEGSFIAPAPMKPEVEAPAATVPEATAPMAPAAAPASPEPFAAADMVNRPQIETPAPVPQAAETQPAARESVSPATRTRAQAILARMSGAARALQAAAQGQESGIRTEPAAQETQSAEAPRPEPAAQPAPAQVVAAPAAQPQPEPRSEPQAGEGQPRLSGLDPADRPSESPVDDDLLDIPAFLRRQAN